MNESVTCQSVPNFLSYVPAKYYLNWFTVGKVITKIKGELFIETQCSYYYQSTWMLIHDVETAEHVTVEKHE